MLDTFCILCLDGLKLEKSSINTTFSTDMLSESSTVWRRADSLAELGVDREDLWVAHEGESKDGNGVRCLRGAQERGNFCHDCGKPSVKAPLGENTWWLQCVKTSQRSVRLAATAYLRVNGEQARGAVGVIVLVDYSIGVLVTVCAWNIQAEVSSGAVGRELLEWAGDLELLVDYLQL